VNLSSNNASVLAVPATVVIAAGQSTGSLTVIPGQVTSATTVTVTATYGGVAQTAALTVNPPSLSAIVILNSDSFPLGGTPSTGTVGLTAPAPPGGLSVALSSSNTSAATVPASVIVPGGQTTATFVINTRVVSADTNVIISGVCNGGPVTAALTVKYGLLSLSINPSTIAGGGGTANGTVTLIAPAPTGGAVVNLYCPTIWDVTIATVPSSVTVPAGQSSVTFPITAGSPSSSTSVSISAGYNTTSVFCPIIVGAGYGLIANAATLTVLRGGSTSSTVGFTPVSGLINNFSISLSGTLPAGLTYWFSSNTLTATGSTLYFCVGVATPPGTYSFTITATTGGYILTAPLTLNIQ